ncbi:unannotated protein [freshwater metagenome]|uniref:Unannotated protein n=1 Tax=freshwater metagenome TaxID=449393 RepID=A0A6J7I4H2_9ZZZZ
MHLEVPAIDVSAAAVGEQPRECGEHLPARIDDAAIGNAEPSLRNGRMRDPEAQGKPSRPSGVSHGERGEGKRQRVTALDRHHRSGELDGGHLAGHDREGDERIEPGDLRQPERIEAVIVGPPSARHHRVERGDVAAPEESDAHVGLHSEWVGRAGRRVAGSEPTVRNEL